ncbi:unnamed protein product [Durusdinium trenchii]|uniref:Ion transport domain-containing protein n=1 Tax=Durusdinium trenchii TaxID=1381693 RepID=A0ABP0P9E4_9DINO
MSAEAEAKGYGHGANGTEFTWNKRKCWGKTLHKKVKEGDQEGVQQLLSHADPGLVHTRFAWIVPYKDQGDQVCTGEAIHLAASRGHVQLLKLLMQHGAQLDSQVTRQNSNNYGVLQAAIFRGGSGGSREMITMLCEHGADISRTNANGDTSLHLAFSTGNEETIQAVHELMKKRKEQNGYWVHPDDAEGIRPETPLEIGFRSGMMNRESLARMAHCCIMSGMFSQKSLARIAQLNSLSPCYVASLKLFIDRAPECIPSFLQMLGSRREELAEALWPEQKEGVIPTCDRLTSDDLEKLLRNSPSAAEALIESCSFHPPDRSDGYNKLPERVSLGPQNALFRLLGLSQSCFQLKCFYETDAEWKEERSWHSQLTQTGQHEEEMKEIKIQLCRVPDIITPGFFSAVLGARVGDKPALFLFESLPVRAAVSFVFWKRAVWTDMLQFIFSLWGLGLLIAETWRARETNCNGMLANAVNATNQTMENPCRQQLTSVFTSSWTLDIAGKELQHERAVVADWIIAKGFVDLILEILQFAGCLFISQKGCYWNFGNFWDLFRSLLPIFLLWFYDSRLLQVLVVLTYWARLLEGATLTEKIGHALLPLQHLLRGLVPAILFTLLGFLALTHALYAVHDQDLDGEHQRLWPNSVWGTFTKLIANELDDTPLKDNMEQVLLLFGVLFFSVFMMNVFIGVINDQYSQEKKTVRLAFQSLRAQSCLTHLLRMRVVPCDLLSARAAATMSVFCVIACVAVQVAALAADVQLPHSWQFMAFFLLQLLTFMASFQRKGCAFPQLSFFRGCESAKYLWICEPRDYGDGRRQRRHL